MVIISCSLSWACCGKKNFNEDNKPPVKKVTRRQKIPTFAPGSILHLIVRHKQKPRYIYVCTVKVSCMPHMIGTLLLCYVS